MVNAIDSLETEVAKAEGVGAEGTHKGVGPRSLWRTKSGSHYAPLKSTAHPRDEIRNATEARDRDIKNKLYLQY